MNTQQADNLACEIFSKAHELGLDITQCQMLANAAHEIALHGEQVTIQQLNQFY
jgi:hypothetical protein